MTLLFRVLVFGILSITLPAVCAAEDLGGWIVEKSEGPVSLARSGNDSIRPPRLKLPADRALSPGDMLVLGPNSKVVYYDGSKSSTIENSEGIKRLTVPQSKAGKKKTGIFSRLLKKRRQGVGGSVTVRTVGESARFDWHSSRLYSVHSTVPKEVCINVINQLAGPFDLQVEIGNGGTTKSFLQAIDSKGNRACIDTGEYFVDLPDWTEIRLRITGPSGKVSQSTRITRIEPETLELIQLEWTEILAELEEGSEEVDRGRLFQYFAESYDLLPVPQLRDLVENPTSK